MDLRIGQINYANCVPLFRALLSECGGGCYSYVRGVPAVLNMMLARGEIDVCPSSSIVYGRDPDRYLLVPGLSISAFGPVTSVLLVSREPLELLDGRSIGLTTESETSVALLRIILGRHLGFSNRFEQTDLPLAAALERYSALLLIGDAALRAYYQPHPFKVYDLGELWYRYTGLPFVFALWIVNRAAMADKGAEIEILAGKLQAAKICARRNTAAYAASEPALDWLDARQLNDYWNTISYELGEPEVAGLTTFFRHARDLGIIAGVPELHFIQHVNAGGEVDPSPSGT
jgi:chorismate dehydratase